MEILALVIAVVALVIAVLAYARTGGIQELRGQVSALGSSTESLRVRTTDTLDSLRAKTADTLERLEKAVRGSGESPAPSVPKEQKPVAEEKKTAPGDKKKDQ